MILERARQRLLNIADRHRIDGILAAHQNTFFYGVTITGIARLLGLRQFCPAAGKEEL